MRGLPLGAAPGAFPRSRVLWPPNARDLCYWADGMLVGGRGAGCVLHMAIIVAVAVVYLFVHRAHERTSQIADLSWAERCLGARLWS